MEIRRTEQKIRLGLGRKLLKILLGRLPRLSLLGSDGQTGGEVERASLVRFAFHPKRTAHHDCELIRDGQSQPGTAVASGGGRVGLRKRFENRSLLLRNDADSRVRHSEVQIDLAGRRFGSR